MQEARSEETFEMNVTIQAILAAHAAGHALTQTIEETYARVARHNDPALFISLRPKSAALAIAEALEK